MSASLSVVVAEGEAASVPVGKANQVLCRDDLNPLLLNAGKSALLTHYKVATARRSLPAARRRREVWVAGMSQNRCTKGLAAAFVEWKSGI